MQIPFSVVVGGVTVFEIVLSGGRCLDHEVSDISHSMSQLAQTEPGIDGTEAHLYARGGRVFTFRFTGKRQHATNLEASTFVLTHPDDMATAHGAASISNGTGSISYSRGLVVRCDVRQNDTETSTTYEIELTKSGS